jgi:glutathione synthase/RimK-type ligase-like ATP-grasp enzyme
MKEYDFGLSWDKNKCYFTRTLMSACKQKGLSFLWVTEDKVRKIVKKLETNQLRIKVFLDTEATYDIPGDLYARLCYAIKDAGGVVINDPDRTRVAVDKSVMYYELMNSGINTPYTVVVRNWEPDSFRLTDDERKKLGIPFIIKPACGWGHRGIVYDAVGTIRQIARARDFDRYDNFLLQEKIHPIELSNKRAWFRVFHVFDKIIPCWWDDRTSKYEQVNGEEFRKHRLGPLARFATRIANMTNMVWFSTEVAIDIKFGQRRFVSIDYVNDQCDMQAQSESRDGVPDNIVKFTAYSMVHAAYQLINKRNIKVSRKYTILLRKRSRFGMRGLGYAPELLMYNLLK